MVRSPVRFGSIELCDRLPSALRAIAAWFPASANLSCSLPFEGPVREGSRQSIGIVDLVLGDPIKLDGLELFIDAGGSPLPR